MEEGVCEMRRGCEEETRLCEPLSVRQETEVRFSLQGNR